jgi:DUF4097 and DUF4098 domain-containing protein YvlB
MISERFETPGRVALDIRCAEGEIFVETSESAATEVDVDAHGSDDAVRELLDATRVEATPAGEGHAVRVSVPRRSGFFRRSVDVRIVVRAPDGADVRVDVASADIRARGRLGSVSVNSASGDVELPGIGDASVKTASGDVRIDDTAGDASVSTASGDVTIGRIRGGANVKSASGDVSIRDAESDTNVSTASGDQVLGAVVRGRVELRSASGDIKVGIATGSVVWVDARSLSGDTSSELELGDAEPATGDGSPVVELSAMSMSGDVTIVRAPAPRELPA